VGRGNAHPRRGGIRSICVASGQTGGARQGIADRGLANGRTFATWANTRTGMGRKMGAVAESEGWLCANQASSSNVSNEHSVKTAIHIAGHAYAN